MINKMINRVIIITFCLAGMSASYAQPQKEKSKSNAAETQTDTAKKPAKVKVRPYKDVVTADAITTHGLITIHKIDDRYLFEIPYAIFNKDLLIMSRIAAASADMRIGRGGDGYAGDPIGGTIIQFEKGPANKLFIRKMSYSEYSKDSTQAMYASVKRNTMQPIVAAFPIAAYKPDSTAVVVDMTDYINSDNDLFYFGSAIQKQLLHIGNQQNDRSYVKYAHTFPTNVELRTIKTYAMAGTTMSGGFTMELNTSMVLLPEKPMKARMYDPRVGYFTTDYTDYDANPQGVKTASLINRWRLEPKPEDLEKYKRGELVEPQKPIVFYIDPTTPKKWIPYLIQGVNDWNAAFEQAGFKNAISARLAPTPEEDPSFDLEDARHSAIIYKPSTMSNASGPSIADPRTGEIIESHINWYHNVMKLIHNWYMIQCGAVDPRARKMEFDDDLMGQLIRFVSSHEVGHTLGLRHNFGASAMVPVEKLRDKAYVEANGHTPSIMDYARFNYVAQPEDHISEAGLFPRIGDYDKWAIEWGYKYYDEFKTPEEEVPFLNKLTIEKLKNKRLLFGTEIGTNDPRYQNEDLGDNAMIASEYGIKNLKRILPQLIEWTKTPNEGYDNLKDMYTALNAQFDRYLVHVIKNIAGVYTTAKTSDQPGDVYERVPASRQREAMKFLDRNVFTTPIWMYNAEVLNRTGQSFMTTTAERQEGVIQYLIGKYRMTRMIEAEASGDKDVYTITEFFKDLNHAVDKELYTHQPIDVYRRNLQKSYVENLISIIKPSAMPYFGAADSPNGPPSQSDNAPLKSQSSDMSSVIKSQLHYQQKLIKADLPFVKDEMTKSHLLDLNDRITAALSVK